ncbi:PREDICTED: uncharacterized protein LOC108564391 [Nicrophorus vespilloides]|uniref:Uncharacterized protein LOC108564391 n=1 Tax=Nicrophorus vespilloides TaxID=110193 RepID=A0ABM1MWG0_NICVS|nr:PREDICTED: uncharacterized protein LOC108564391 [Nicrophorus vespilloides]
MKCKIKSVVYNEKAPRPINLTFTNGKLNLDGESGNCQLYRTKDEKFVPIFTADGLEYNGETNRSEEYYRDFMVIKKKNSNSMKLFAIDNVLMKPKLKKDNANKVFIKNDNKQDMIMFAETFGSKREVKQSTTYAKMWRKDDDVNETMNNILKDEDLSEKQWEYDHSSLLSYLPEVNENAEKVEDVYNLSKLIPEDIQEELLPTINDLLDGAEVEITNTYLSLKIKRICENCMDKDDFKLKRDLGIYLFCDALLTVTQHEILKGVPKCAVSREVSKYLIKIYTIQKLAKRFVSKECKAKAFSVLIILLLITHDFKLDMELIASNFPIGFMELQRYALYVRCTNDKKYSVLKLPLKPLDLTRRLFKKK